jgi:diguanylate cyclase (GGDEF)-like protein
VERINHQIAGEVYSGSGNQEFRVTCSIGVAEFDPESDDIKSLLERADQALYQAKNSGRNQICSVAVKPGSL